MNRKKLWKIVAATASTVLTITTIETYSAQAASYTFTKIADTNGSFDFLLNASINDDGTVVFNASLDEGGDGLFDGIFIANNKSLATLVDTSGLFDDFLFPPIINNKGTVAFSALLDDGSTGIFTSRSGTIATIADDNGPFENLSSSFISLNDNDAVAFDARLDTGVEGIFISEGGMPTAIIDNSDNPFNGFFRVPALNNNGTVAFSAYLSEFGIFTSSRGGSFSTIVADRDPFDPSKNLFFRSFGDRLAFNDNGTVVFTASVGKAGPGTDPNQVEGIFRSDDGVLTTLVDSRGLFGSFFDYVAIDNRGTVAFEACVGGNVVCGIFTGSDPVKDKIIDTSDLLFGSELNQISFFRDGLNNSGQIVFRATFTDGTSAIVRADPVPVPDPSSALSLVALGTIGAGSTILRQHKQHKSTK
jgi:hypothetical protein